MSGDAGKGDVLLDFAEELQSAATLEEVARAIQSAVAAVDPASRFMLELRGTAPHASLLWQYGEPPPKGRRIHGMAWQVRTHGSSVSVLLFRNHPAYPPQASGVWAELRRQARPALLRALDCERMLADSSDLRDHLARNGMATIPALPDARVPEPTPQALEILSHHYAESRDWRDLLARIAEHLGILPAQPGAEVSLGHVRTTNGALSFTVRTSARGDLQMIFLTEDEHHSPDSRIASMGLPPRQTEILHWIREGKSNPEIAQILGIGRETVKEHVGKLLRHFGVTKRGELAALARISHTRAVHSGYPG